MLKRVHWQDGVLWLESLQLGPSVVGFYTEKWQPGMVRLKHFFWGGGALDRLELRDRKRDVLRKERTLKTCGKTHSNL